MRLTSYLAIPLCSVALATAASAQRPPARPELDKKADVNDWEAYYDYGVAAFTVAPKRSDAAFYWAHRLDPTRAEPLYARWAAFWMIDIGPWTDYLDGMKEVVKDPKVIRNDSLLVAAYERNPFVNQALQMLLWGKLGVDWHHNPYARGWFAYANVNYAQALVEWRSWLASNPDHIWVRWDVVQAFAELRRYDSAAVEMQKLIGGVRKEDRETLVYAYESKEMVEYALGLLYAAQGKLGDAQEAQGRALQENLAFAPAHVALGRLAAARRDTANAAAEYALAVELAPTDAAMQFWYGVALLRAQRAKEAVEHLRTATTLEPYFADPYLSLGVAYASLNDTTHAIAAFKDYVARAPRKAADNAALATQRLTELGGKAP